MVLIQERQCVLNVRILDPDRRKTICFFPDHTFTFVPFGIASALSTGHVLPGEKYDKNDIALLQTGKWKEDR